MSQDYFQAIRNSVGPLTARGKAREELERVMERLRSGGMQERSALRKAIRGQMESEWRPGSMMEWVLLNQLVDTILWLQLIGDGHDAAVSEAGERSPGLPIAKAILAEMNSNQSSLNRLHAMHRSLVRQQRQLMHDLRTLQEQRALADEEVSWQPTPDHPVEENAKCDAPPFIHRPRVKERLNGQAQRASSPATQPDANAQPQPKKSNPILAQAVAAMAANDNVAGGLKWPTGPLPVTLPNGQIIDDWNRPDRK